MQPAPMPVKTQCHITRIETGSIDSKHGLIPYHYTNPANSPQSHIDRQHERIIARRAKSPMRGGYNLRPRAPQRDRERGQQLVAQHGSPAGNPISTREQLQQRQWQHTSNNSANTPKTTSRQRSNQASGHSHAQDLSTPDDCEELAAHHSQRGGPHRPVSEYQANLDSVSPECRDLFLSCCPAPADQEGGEGEDDDVDTYWTWSREKMQWFHVEEGTGAVVWFPDELC